MTRRWNRSKFSQKGLGHLKKNLNLKNQKQGIEIKELVLQTKLKNRNLNEKTNNLNKNLLDRKARN